MNPTINTGIIPKTTQNMGLGQKKPVSASNNPIPAIVTKPPITNAGAAYERKDLLISRMSAEKAAAELSRAYADMLVASGTLTGLREEEIKSWLTAFRKSQYEFILKEINL